MVAAGNGAAALEQLAPTDGPDADGLWDQASAAVRAERMFVKAAATALMAIRSGEGLDAALAGLRDFLRKHSGSHHAADGFVAGHQRIAHAREGGHGAFPQQALGSRTDTAVLNRNFDVGSAHIGQGHLRNCQRFRVLEDDCLSLHGLYICIDSVLCQ
jgi:hypothetical protein